MNVLITGAAGFLGRHLVTSLLDEGHQVVGVDDFITSDAHDLVALRKRPGFDFAMVDVTTPEFEELASRSRFDAIYHLACPTGVPNLVPLALEMLRTCYEGSLAVLEIARRNAAPALLTSSAEVYGNPLIVPQSEEYTGNVDPLGPRKGYEEGKRVAETLFAIYAERYGVQAKIVRVFNTYGPGMSQADTRVIPAFVTAALFGRSLIIHGAGQQTRCHTYVADMVQGLRRAMLYGQPGRAYNLGSEVQTTVSALARQIIESSGSCAGLRYTDRPVHDHDNRLPDITRAVVELGWSPVTGLSEGLTATIADFRERLGLRSPNPVGAMS